MNPRRTLGAVCLVVFSTLASDLPAFGVAYTIKEISSSKLAPFISGDRLVWNGALGSGSIEIYDIPTGTTTVQAFHGVIEALDENRALCADSKGRFVVDLKTQQTTRLNVTGSMFQPRMHGDMIVYWINAPLPNNAPYQKLFLYNIKDGTTKQIDGGPTRNINAAVRNGKVVWEHYTRWPNPDPIHINLYDGVLHENISKNTSGIAELADITDKYAVWSQLTGSSNQIMRYRLSDGRTQPISPKGEHALWPAADGEMVVWRQDSKAGITIKVFDGRQVTSINPVPFPRNKMSTFIWPKISRGSIVWCAGDEGSPKTFLATPQAASTQPAGSGVGAGTSHPAQ